MFGLQGGSSREITERDDSNRYEHHTLDEGVNREGNVEQVVGKGLEI